VSTIADAIANRWDGRAAADLSEPDLLRYRSNLLGADLRLTNYGGGNTSAKVQMSDPLTGEPVDVLWVKGSGGDLGSMTLDGFATLYLQKVHDLRRQYRGIADEDEMVDRFTHCTYNLNPRATSIDTPLHAFVPHRHVDHMHADAIIAIAASRHGERLTREIFGGELAWVGWQRPGFDLGLKVGEIATGGPALAGLVMGSHGLMTWGPTSRECYETTLRIVRKAAEWLTANGRSDPFGATVAPALPEAERRAIVAAVAPALRKALSRRVRKVMHYRDTPEVLEFVGSARCDELSARGTTCPDHFLRTKVRPLVVPFDPATESAADLAARIEPLAERYAEEYAAYYERCRRPGSPAMRDPYPVLILVPGVGLLSFQKDKQTARVAADYWVNTINVMRWSEGVDEYVPIPEQDAFDIEYWLLEEAKLQRMPKPKSLEGRIAVITGGVAASAAPSRAGCSTKARPSSSRTSTPGHSRRRARLSRRPTAPIGSGRRGPT
jgi:rhamnulose-1-phosphate aldolase/alcohol dehydrogenase